MDTTVSLKTTGTIMLQLLQSPYYEYYMKDIQLALLKTYSHGQRLSAMRRNRQIDQITTHSSNGSTYTVYW